MTANLPDCRTGSPRRRATRGWHRLEHILWTTNSTAGAAPLADRLDRDLETLHRAVLRLRVTPAMMANGFTRLVDEAIADKLPGVEDAYAHTDLADLAGNVQGAEAGYTIVRPALAVRDAGVVRIVDGRFAGAAAMAASDGSMTALGVTDPRQWDANSWLSDALPHLAYGAVTIATLHALDRP